MRRFLLEQTSYQQLRLFMPFGLLEDILVKGFPDSMIQAVVKNLVPDNYHVLGNNDQVRLTINSQELNNKQGFKTLEAIEKIEISSRIVPTERDIEKLEKLAQGIQAAMPHIQVHVVDTWSNDRNEQQEKSSGVFFPKEKWYLTQEAIDLIKKREGKPSLTPFWDVKQWAIGYGHMLTSKDQMGSSITPEKAEELFKQDLKRFEDAVKDFINVPLTLSMYGALVSYAYNVGRTGFKNSDVAAAVNNKNYQQAAEIMKRSKVHDPSSKYHRGLLARRDDESKFFGGDGFA